MADQNGPLLPPINSDPGTNTTERSSGQNQGIVVNFNKGPSTKDVMIGVGALLVLTIVFFFVRNAFVNYLVSSLRRSPNNAGLAGWGLFGGLFFGAALGSLAIISQSLITLPSLIALSALSLICFVIMLMVAMKKG